MRRARQACLERGRGRCFLPTKREGVLRELGPQELLGQEQGLTFERTFGVFLQRRDA